MTLARVLVLIAFTLTVTACGGGTEYDASGKPPAAEGAGGGHSGHGSGEAPAGATTATAPAEGESGEHSGHSGGGGAAESTDGADSEMEGMVTLAKTETSDLAVELHSMPPELFYVSEGDGFRPQRPSAKDSAHFMVTLADKESAVRLPEATVTTRITGEDGETAFEGPLYPMVGRGMGLHYGENIELPRAGRYTVRLVIGPPRIGRHRAVQKAWNTPARIEQAVEFDGRAVKAR